MTPGLAIAWPANAKTTECLPREGTADCKPLRAPQSSFKIILLKAPESVRTKRSGTAPYRD